MARDFESSGANQYLSIDSASVSAYPFSFSCWINVESQVANMAPFWIGDKDVTNNYHWISLAGGNLYIESRNTSLTGASVSYTPSNGTWAFIAGVWASATSRKIYLNGSSTTAEGTTSVLFGSADRMTIGRAGDSSPDRYFDGLIAEAGFWDIALTTAEIDSLAKGFSPLCIRTASLLNYWNLLGNNSPETDIVGGFNLTLAGTPAVAPHPRIIYPSLSQIRRFTTASTPPASTLRYWRMMMGVGT